MINFKVELENELEVMMMDEEKVFTLYIYDGDSAERMTKGLSEEELNSKIAALISRMGK